MRSNFSLSRQPEKVFVTSIEIDDGIVYPIDPSFRVVLACLRIIADPDKPEIEKALYIAQRFFLAHPPPNYPELFGEFVTGGEHSDEDEDPVMDFELDAGVIYASFRQQYNIDLLHTDLHWVEFHTLLSGLGEDTPFGARVRLRGMKPDDVAEKDRFKLRKLQDMVAIKPRMSKEEQALSDELNRRLASGEDPTDILQQLQGV